MIVIALTLALTPTQTLSEESPWAIKQVHIGQSSNDLPMGYTGRPALDVDRDGYEDIFIDECREWISYPSNWRNYWGRYSGRGLRLLNLRRVPQSEFFARYSAILNRDERVEVIVDRSRHQVPIEAERIEYPTGNRLGFIDTPPQPPGIEATNPLNSATHVGDLDGDGFDDAIGWNYAVRVDVDPPYALFAFSRLDGNSMEVAWTTRFHRVTGGMTLSDRAMQLVDDVNSDGTKDVVVMVFYADPAPRNAIAMLSGADGTILWELSDFPGPPVSNLSVKTIADISGDGARDVVIWLPPGPHTQGEIPGHFATVASDTGEIIWYREMMEDLPWWPDGQNRLTHMSFMGELGDINGDLVPDLAFSVGIRLLSDPLQARPRVWIYSGANGQMLERERWPERYEPWFSEEFPLAILDPLHLSFAGDLDGDGWSDIAIPLRTQGFPLGSAHFTVIGRRTLSLPNTSALGERINGSLWIPKGAGMEYQLLVSSAFERDGEGIRVGVWDTHLGWSALTPWSKSQAGNYGVLDANGRANFEVRTPSFAHLRGKDVHVVAVIKNPAQPDGVQTLSTLETITLE